MVLVWTGKNRSASDVLNNVKNNIIQVEDKVGFGIIEKI